MASPAHQIAAAPAEQLGLPDEILEDIFLCLDSPADLARSSAACTAFRCVVTGRRFLRRFRSLHHRQSWGSSIPSSPGRSTPPRRPTGPPPPRRPPTSPSPSSRPPNDWNVCDARDLLYRRVSPTKAFEDLVVCDPLHRRYVQLPPIPDDLAVSTGARGMTNFKCFLDPASKEKRENEDDVSFRVICAVQFQHKPVTFHLSSVTGKWRALMFDREISLPTAGMTICPRQQYYVHGCFYWTIAGGSVMEMQDTREMRLCNVEIPTVTCHQQKAIVEVGEGRLGLLALHDGIFDLYCKNLQDNCIGTEEWQHDRTIPLPNLYSDWCIIGADKGYVLLMAIPEYVLPLSRSWLQIPPIHYFTLDLKTFLVEILSVSNLYKGAYLYASFPPPLSLPSI